MNFIARKAGFCSLVKENFSQTLQRCALALAPVSGIAIHQLAKPAFFLCV
jgi:hypothetical protein